MDQVTNTTNGLAAGNDCSKSLQTEYLTFNLVCYGLATIFVALRLYSRVFLVKYFGVDDVWILISMGIALAILTLDLVYVEKGYTGSSFDCIGLEGYAELTRAQYISNPFFAIELQTVKMSLLTFYLRLSASPTFRKIVYTTMVVTWIFTFGVFFGAIFACFPPEKAWDLTVIRTGTYRDWCHNLWAFTWSWAILSIIFDWWVLLLPVKMLIELRVDWKQRAIVIANFLIGLLACVAAIVRIPALKIVTHTPDSLHGTYLIDLTIAVEHSVSIIAACCPALKPLIRKVFPSLIKCMSINADTRELGNSASDTIVVSLTGESSTLEASSEGQQNSYNPQGRGRRKFSWVFFEPRTNKQEAETPIGPDQRISTRSQVSLEANGLEQHSTGHDTIHQHGKLRADGEAATSIRRGKIDLEDNDFCINPNFQHQLPARQKTSKMSMDQELFRDDRSTHSGS